MKQSGQKSASLADRRSFLKLAGAGAVTGGAAVTTAAVVAAPSQAADNDSLYRETEHIKRYYDLARF